MRITHPLGLSIAGSLLAGLLLGPAAHAQKVPNIDGAAFANAQGQIYAPARALGKWLSIPVRWDTKSDVLYLGQKKISAASRRALFGGQQLVAVGALKHLGDGTKVQWDAKSNTALITRGQKAARVRVGAQKVIVNRKEQEMRAYQGNLLVLKTAVSTGRPGKGTPKGHFIAGPLKTPMLISHIYNDAKMPWSVQLDGDIVVHGFTSIPDYAASHGCVRVPLTNGNPAKWFYDWVNVGTPIIVADSWKDAPGATPKPQNIARAQAKGKAA